MESFSNPLYGGGGGDGGDGVLLGLGRPPSTASLGGLSVAFPNSQPHSGDKGANDDSGSLPPSASRIHTCP